MADLTKREKLEKETLYQIGYEYLRKNFHKLSQSNKIRVAISMLQIFNKDDSKSATDIKQIVVMTEIKKDDNPIRFVIGQNQDAPLDVNSS